MATKEGIWSVVVEAYAEDDEKLKETFKVEVWDVSKGLDVKSLRDISVRPAMKIATSKGGKPQEMLP